MTRSRRQSSAGGEPKPISSEDEFREWLRAQLASDDVRTAIGNLFRYVHEARRVTRSGSTGMENSLRPRFRPSDNLRHPKNRD